MSTATFEGAAWRLTHMQRSGCAAQTRLTRADLRRAAAAPSPPVDDAARRPAPPCWFLWRRRLLRFPQQPRFLLVLGRGLHSFAL